MDSDIRQYLQTLAVNAYEGRQLQLAEDEDTNLIKSLEDLKSFCSELIFDGKKVVLSIEFGIRKFERYRFAQLVNLLAKKHFSKYEENEDVVYVILGVDADFDNSSMRATLGELLDGLSESYRLVGAASQDDFQVRPLPGEEVGVVSGTSNVYSFVLEEKEVENIYEGGGKITSNNRKISNTTRKNKEKKGSKPPKTMSVCTYLIKHFIKSSYFTNCSELSLYHKAQQSSTIQHFARHSVPVLPFWRKLLELCMELPFKSIFYANFTHLETNGLFYDDSFQKVFSMYQVRINKFSEKMSELWYILFQALDTTPVFVFDTDLTPSFLYDLPPYRTFDTQGVSRILPLTEDLAFYKQEEATRFRISENVFNSIEEFTNQRNVRPSMIPFNPVGINWNTFCNDALQNVAVAAGQGNEHQGGTRKRKARAQKKKRTRRSRA